MKQANGGTFICSFVGDYDAPRDLLSEVYNASSRLLSDREVTTFWVGGYGNFNFMAALAIDLIKPVPQVNLIHCPLIKLNRYVPCCFHFNEQSKSSIRYGQTEQSIQYDNTISMMEDTPALEAVPKIYRYMIKNANYIIAYVKATEGIDYEALQFAQRLEREGKLKIIYLFN